MNTGNSGMNNSNMRYTQQKKSPTNAQAMQMLGKAPIAQAISAQININTGNMPNKMHHKNQQPLINQYMTDTKQQQLKQPQSNNLTLDQMRQKTSDPKQMLNPNGKPTPLGSRKKASPEVSTYNQIDPVGGGDQTSNILHFLKKRASEEKQNFQLNNSGGGGSQNRNGQQPVVMYQEYMGTKSRSPQNQGSGNHNIKLEYQYNMQGAPGNGQGVTKQPSLQFNKSRNQIAQANKQQFKTTQPEFFQNYSPKNVPGFQSKPLFMNPAMKQKIGSPIHAKAPNIFQTENLTQYQAYQSPQRAPQHFQFDLAGQNKANQKLSGKISQQNISKRDIQSAQVHSKQQQMMKEQLRVPQNQLQNENLVEDDEAAEQDGGDNDGDDDEDGDGMEEGRESMTQKQTLKEQARKLWLAVEVGDQVAAIKVLQNSDPSSINSTNSDGWAPLHVASNEGHASLVQLLIEYGALLDARTKNFRTPLHIACIRGNFGVIQTLLIAGSDPDAKDIDCNTPAHFCAEYGHKECLRFLLTRHPTLFAKNSEGRSPIDVAVNHEILQTFEEYIKSVKNFLHTKNTNHNAPNQSAKPQVASKPHLNTGEESQSVNQNNSQSNQSNNSNNSGNQKQQWNIDDKTLKQRAKNKQIKIFESQVQKEQKESTEQVKVMLVKEESKNSKGSESTVDTTPKGGIAQASSTQSESDEKIGPMNFTPLKLLGSGSFGEVYLVKDKKNSNLYAMKVLSKEKIMGQNLVRYAKTERDVLSYTKHPFIVNLNYAFQTKTKLFLILDFCPGGDLGKILQKERKFSEDRARIYICELLLALEDLHKRDIIYRDLKPDNVVLDEDGHAQLTDFGLSKEGVLDSHKGAKSFCGSVAYLAPEMLRRVGHGKAVDWYLLGVLLYEMLVGCPPYFSAKKDELFYNIQKGVLRIPASLSEDAKSLIVMLLNRNPSRRLGGGPNGAEEIKAHAFFNSINWKDVKEKKLYPPKPEINMTHFQNLQASGVPETSNQQQMRRVFEDLEETTLEDRNVEGWSFVNMQGQKD